MSAMDVDVDVNRVADVSVGLDELKEEEELKPRSSVSGTQTVSLDANMKTIGTREEVVKAFEAFRAELDEHHDRRERLIKMSRDITTLSKKLIFLLHRLASQSTSSTSPPTTTHTTAHTHTRHNPASIPLPSVPSFARTQLTAIESLFRSMRPDLARGNFYRYQSAVSPGLQEYIEALAFAHYLAEGRLIGYEEVRARLRDADGEYFPLPLEEYLLGVSDLTGELMRFAITAIGRKGGRQKAREVSDFVRLCKADFDGFTPYVKFLGKKQAVTAQSLLKIEDAAYAISVRASEYAGSEEMLEDVVERCVMDVRSKRYERDAYAYDGGGSRDGFGSAGESYEEGYGAY